MCATHSVAADEWNIQIEEDDPRRKALMQERSTDDLAKSFATDVAVDVRAGNVNPRFQPAGMRPTYRRFEAVIRLSEDTFDALMNGRCGYRAQFYIGLNSGRKFNRLLIDSVFPDMRAAWEHSSGNREPWSLAERSLADATAKIWPEHDVAALDGQPKLNATMWQINCEELGADPKGLSLFSPKPPTIEIKGGWISQQSSEPWLPVDKRCRDELLRCFGFT